MDCDYTCYGCIDEAACNWDPEATLDDGTCDYISCFVFACTDPSACNYDSDANFDDGTCTYDDADGNGICDEDEFSGCILSVACNYDEFATQDDGSCEFTSCGGCLTPTACNYDPTLIYHYDDACEFPDTGYDCNGVCLLDTDGDGVCDESEMPGCDDPEADNYDPTVTENDGSCFYYGCTISVACNYDATANSNDGSCEFTSCAGCTTPTACNYDPTVTYHNALTCIYPEEGYDCDGVCLVDTDLDGVCDMFEIPGCDDVDALNYDPIVTENDGSCIY
jgi:hypothetical protein